MPVEPIIMPAFLVPIIFKVFFEFIYHTFSIQMIVNEKSRSISKIDVRATKTCGANDNSISYWCHLFYFDVHGLSIPCMNSILKHFQYFNNFFCIFSCPHYSSSWNRKIINCFIDFALLWNFYFNLSFIILK
jgi:hypothetical protein